ncbi:MAG: hypothetical protein ACK2T5_03205, partial [Anaerolineales bacterium]
MTGLLSLQTLLRTTVRKPAALTMLLFVKCEIARNGVPNAENGFLRYMQTSNADTARHSDFR